MDFSRDQHREVVMLRVGDKLTEVFDERFHLAGHQYLLIVWLRHFGCRFFQEAKLLLPSLKAELDREDVHLIGVVQGDEEEIKTFWPFEDIDVVGDPQKVTYKAIGLERTSLFKILFPNQRLKQRRTQATERGCSMNKAGTKSKSSDILQLPGVSLVDFEKRIVWLHRGKHTGDLDLGPELVTMVREKTQKLGPSQSPQTVKEPPK